MTIYGCALCKSMLVELCIQGITWKHSIPMCCLRYTQLRWCRPRWRRRSRRLHPGWWKWWRPLTVREKQNKLGWIRSWRTKKDHAYNSIFRQCVLVSLTHACYLIQVIMLLSNYHILFWQHCFDIWWYCWSYCSTYYLIASDQHASSSAQNVG